MKRILLGLLALSAGCDGDDAPIFRAEAVSVEPQAGGEGFLPKPDLSGGIFQCDLWTQNCGAGDKCMPWSPDGGPWNATRCTPVVDNPRGPDDPCVVEGNIFSGIDDCERHSMCWSQDARTNMGTCVPFPFGGPDNAVCADRFRVSSISSGGQLILCAPGCDPIVQDCEPGQACYAFTSAVRPTTRCAPDVSGDLGGPGDLCEFINTCAAGNWCIDPALVPDCTGGGCCSPVCDLDAPSCPDRQVCTPWYEPGYAPPGSEAVGICTLAE